MASLKVRRTQEIEVIDLPKKLREARGERSLVQISELSGISRLSLRNFEKGKVGAIAYPTLQRLEKVLGVDFGITFED